MPNTNPSANMSLPIPVVGTDPGPDYANNVNASLTILDAHNHSAGSGVQITPSGLNINADLNFNSNNAYGLRSSRFNAQSSLLSLPADIGCLYVSGVDLYYNDISGNQVRITSGGAVAGTPGSISGLASPASASYSSGTSTFIFQSDSNKSANIDGGSILIREVATAANAVTISSPTSLSANYTLTLLPSLPSSQQLLTVNNSGNITVISDITDESTLTQSGVVLSIKNQGVTQAKKEIRSTGTSVGAGGIAIASSSGNFVEGSGILTLVTNQSITITTLGNPVSLSLNPSGGSLSYLQYSGTVGQFTTFYIYRDSTIIYQSQVEGQGSTTIVMPPGIINYVDAVSAGTYTYTLKVVANVTISIVECSLRAYEL